MSQVERNINALKAITNKIKSFDCGHGNGEEISLLIKELDIIVRSEQSKYYKDFFSDLSLANKMLSIYKTGKINSATSINIVSLIGNMIKRYGLSPTNALFDFFYEIKDLKKINYYVSLFIMQFPQFHMREDKWDYLISVSKIAPKDKSERNFYIEVRKIINSNEVVPEYYKDKIIIVIRGLIDRAKNDFYKNEYKELISILTMKGSINNERNFK